MEGSVVYRVNVAAMSALSDLVYRGEWTRQYVITARHVCVP
jgi:hypothetical protein